MPMGKMKSKAISGAKAPTKGANIKQPSMTGGDGKIPKGAAMGTSKIKTVKDPKVKRSDGKTFND